MRPAVRMSSQLRRSINGVLILGEVARAHGQPLERLLHGTGLVAADLQNPSKTVSFDQEFRIIRNLLDHCGDATAVGFEAGLRYRFTTLASVGFAFVSSPTLRSAFDISLRYADLNATLVRVVLDAPAPDLRIGFLEHELPADLRGFAVERSMGVALEIAREVLSPDVMPLAVHFTFAKPADARIYERLAGVMPSFGQPKSLMIMRQEDVDAPLARGNGLALRMAEDHCRQLLETWKPRIGLASRVRELIAAQPGRIVGMREIAATLCMSDRTLRRRLDEEGATYATLCEEVRQALAERLLAMPRLPVEQVAQRLGYSDAASFIHAFRRWKGCTPKAYRAGLGHTP